MSRKSLVKDYMTRNVISVKKDTLNEDIIKIMNETGHDGFPVVDDDEKVLGIVTAFDLLMNERGDFVKDIMSTEVVVAQEEMKINDASRVMFRKGISRFPVVDREEKLKGIITNMDMVRSHIERSTPSKVDYFKQTIEQLYGIKTSLNKKKVELKKLRPTQDKIFADELEGRYYELQGGLSEPAIVIKTGNRWVLVDGHHRAVAAIQLGYDFVDAYVIDLEQDLKLGMEKTAEKSGIYTFDDIEKIEHTQHPLIAVTESLQKQHNNEENDK
ncbi:inosine-5'-monophosphate dehydrogenase [Methanobrevibacter filiformis]|uniref:Inosine-5'-monophosphate dehydrogenase n=1 Tax=Methanobrevibacter filiformis TaxID=55758 RepID=A0A165Z4H9_9EURY|nr:inosine-5'-monophosphate dehydrogenase [Methanobrevibacter filiformis]